MRKIAAALAECGPDPTVPPQCFEDSNTQRIMPFTVTLRDNSMTQEQCAGACLAENFTVFGVEFGVACFCAPDDWPQGANATKLPESSYVPTPLFATSSSWRDSKQLTSLVFLVSCMLCQLSGHAL